MSQVSSIFAAARQYPEARFPRTWIIAHSFPYTQSLILGSELGSKSLLVIGNCERGHAPCPDTYIPSLSVVKC